MKANELTTEVFVYFNCFDGSKIVVRVTGFKDGIVYGDSKNGSHWCNIDKVEPILLTQEILEKNGFNVEQDSDGEYYADIMFEDQGRRVEVDYRYGVDIDVCVIGRNNTPPFSRIETQVRYIHELQNIFRIMQINKEIVF